MKAVLRNTNYTKSIFYKLNFNLEKEPVKILSEGYQVQKGSLSIPMMEQDPHNVYNNMPTGNYFTLKDINIAIYNQELHEQYKQFHENRVYNWVDVFQTWWGYYESSHVHFNQCYIQDSDISVAFFKVTFNETTIENVHFKRVDFENCKFIHTTFVNCQFENCKFKGCTFNCTVFLNCDIKSLIKTCHLSGRFIRCDLNITFEYTEMWPNLFEDCVATGTQWGCYYPFIEKHKNHTSFQHHFTNKEFANLLNKE